MRSASTCSHVRLLVENQIWPVRHFDPAACLLKRHMRHHRVGIASCTSAVCVEPIHEKAIQAFKCFRWMLNRTNQWMGHFHLIPGRGHTGKLSVGFQRISIYFGALGLLRSKAKPKRIHDVGELLSFTVPANGKKYE